MDQLLNAIQFATRVHQGQTRKGKETPYIIHPLGVGLLLSQVNADQNTVIAGILHDTIEDCKPYGSVTKALLAQTFNQEIADLVDHVTEQDKTLSWEERKKRANEHIPHMPQKALLIKAADTLYNINDKLQDYELHGEKLYAFFNAPKERQLANLEERVSLLATAWPENPLLPDIRKTVAVFKQKAHAAP